MIKIVVQSISMFKKTPKGNLLKSFVKIHFPMILSIILLLLMISTFIGAAHFENGVLSIEPNSRNLVIYADDTPNDRSISVRGPYTIDAAIENESGEIRMPSEAMMTLGVKEMDNLRIKGESYVINETRPGEPDILRLPINAKNALDVQNDDIIQNSRLKEVFEGAVVTHVNDDNDNFTFSEKFAISSRYKNATSFEILLNGASIANSTGIFKDNASYSISVDDDVETFVYYEGIDRVSFDDYGIELAFKHNNETSTNKYVQDSQSFLNFYFKTNDE
jgi:hypothetical protein